MGTILVVEPDKNQQLLLEEELNVEGYTTLTAENGEAALGLVLENTPDLVVLDLHMPGIDGLDLLGRLHAIDNRLPVVIHTADDSYRDNYLAWMADAYVVKRADFADLKRALRRILGRGRARQAGHAAPCLAR